MHFRVLGSTYGDEFQMVIRILFLSSDILSDDISTNYITQEYGRIRSSMEMGIERAGGELSQ